MTKIEWCDDTANPFVGCSKCSPGCDNCYAERFAARMVKNPNPKIAAKYAGITDAAGKWTGKCSSLDLTPFHKLPQKQRLQKTKRVFVGSMTDLFHRGTSFEDLRHIWKQMAFLSQYTFCILTKRPDRMYAFCEDNANPALRNVWLGVTICNQAEADEKIPVLLDTPAAKRFVSAEPMLGPMDLTKCDPTGTHVAEVPEIDALTGYVRQEIQSPTFLHTVRTQKLDWVICGGESGPGARPVHPDWIRGLREQCVDAGVPFFFKGWGDWITIESTNKHREDWRDIPEMLRSSGIDHRHCLQKNGYLKKGTKDWFDIDPDSYRAGSRGRACPVGKKRAGRLLDGREWNEVPT
jgi:protein gp37